MSKLEKLSLWIVIFNAAYFASTDSDLIKMGSWILMVCFGVIFIFWEQEF